jgi:hypothetical protein
MVYASLTFTPMHDLMVTMSLAFHLCAVVALLHGLWIRRETAFFWTGCICFLVLLASAEMYYTNHLGVALVWAQRLTFILFASWLLILERYVSNSNQLQCESNGNCVL